MLERGLINFTYSTICILTICSFILTICSFRVGGVFEGRGLTRGFVVYEQAM